MANQFMAHFGPSYVETTHFGENNAVKYKLELQGSNFDSSNTVSFVKINGANTLSATARGINVITIDENGVASNQAAFDIYQRPEHFDTLRAYLMSAPSNRIIALVSWDAIKSSVDFDTFMRQYGAISWPGVEYLNKANTNGSAYYRSSYVAIFNTTLKRFCYENFVGNSPGKTEDTAAKLEAVFDIVEDIGACGTPERKVDDITEYFSSGNDYAFVRYFPTENISNFEAVYHVKCEIYRDQALIDANGQSRLYVWSQDASGKWYNQLILGDTSVPADTWTTFEGYYKLPIQSLGATMWGCQAYRWPSSVKVGRAGARNVSVTRVTRDDDDKVTNAAFGVNGMRSNKIEESVDLGNPIMQLLNLKPNNVTTSHELRERS
ncbi:long tail fiber protein proximal connector [Aeromonas phage GomatiRiver_11]|nr:long-tail fiber protein [Aeromonas phage AhFM11]WKW84207.1 long tail fiber protein proximal connector [Aeromonas phage GomatiRiver_11]